jgi:membrane associated rhomboid family serine protease
VDQERAITEKPTPNGPWSDLAAAEPPREPLSKAPWPPLLVAAVLIGIYAWQSYTGEAQACTAGYARADCIRYGFSPHQLDLEQWSGLVTALFMHGSWAHVLFNSIFMIAFGAPVAKLFGLDVKGVLAFLVFFLACGVLGNLGFALINLHSPTPVVGASGAIAGFMGAASRLLDRRTADGGFNGLAPFTSRTVVAMAAAWVVINVVVGVLGVDIGFGAAGQPVAWEAHLFGYAAGLLLIAPATWMLGIKSLNRTVD